MSGVLFCESTLENIGFARGFCEDGGLCGFWHDGNPGASEDFAGLEGSFFLQISDDPLDLPCAFYDMLTIKGTCPEFAVVMGRPEEFWPLAMLVRDNVAPLPVFSIITGFDPPLSEQDIETMDCFDFNYFMPVRKECERMFLNILLKAAKDGLTGPLSSFSGKVVALDVQSSAPQKIQKEIADYVRNRKPQIHGQEIA